MQSKATTLAAYFEELPPEQRRVIVMLDELVRTALPGATGTMKYGMPVYELDARMIGFNAQKQYYAFYADPDIVALYKSELTGLSVGKSCIRFRKPEDAPIATLRKILSAYRH
jgi:uncharacterized protein YdhG (YjbR/CyaY superfamily)